MAARKSRKTLSDPTSPPFHTHSPFRFGNRACSNSTHAFCWASHSPGKAPLHKANSAHICPKEMLSLVLAVLSWLSVGYVLFLCIQLLRILLSDCDLILSLYERLGKQPAATLGGKVVWITGASSGIGEAIAYELASVGARLILSARNKAELERVANKCRGGSQE